MASDPGADPLRFWELERGPDGQGDPVEGNLAPELQNLRASIAALERLARRARVTDLVAAEIALARSLSARSTLGVHRAAELRRAIVAIRRAIQEVVFGNTEPRTDEEWDRELACLHFRIEYAAKQERERREGQPQKKFISRPDGRGYVPDHDRLYSDRVSGGGGAAAG